MHIDNVIFLILSKNAYTKFSEGPYTQYRGLTQVANWVKLKFAAMNLKKLARWLWRDTVSSFAFLLILPIYTKKPVHA